MGGGLAGFTAYATLRHGGLAPAEIAVFGTDPDPASEWRQRAAAIRQRRMRSESDGHVAPTAFPGLAVRSAIRHRDALPLVQSLFDRYHPSVADFLEHVAEVRERSGWDASFRRRRIGAIRAVDGGFELDDAGTFAHVLMAPGHPGLAFPEGLEGDERAVHSYQSHDYADEIEVVGAGMAAATEWLNALAAGAAVTSVRRREPERRPLNLPRELFTRRGLRGFHATSKEQRVGLLRSWSTPSYPSGRDWDEPLERARREGRFRILPELNGGQQIICATGFKMGFRNDSLLAALVDIHALETADGWIALAPDSTVPSLTDETRTLSVAGVPAQWAFPAADTLAGHKYAARRFLRRIRACRTR